MFEGENVTLTSNTKFVSSFGSTQSVLSVKNHLPVPLGVTVVSLFPGLGVVVVVVVVVEPETIVYVIIRLNVLKSSAL